MDVIRFFFVDFVAAVVVIMPTVLAVMAVITRDRKLQPAKASPLRQRLSTARG